MSIYSWDSQMDMYKEYRQAQRTAVAEVEATKKVEEKATKTHNVSLYLCTYELPLDSKKAKGRGEGVLPGDSLYIYDNGKVLVESYFVQSEDMPPMGEAVSGWYADTDYEVKPLTTTGDSRGYMVTYQQSDGEGNILYASDFAFNCEGAFCVISFWEYENGDKSIRKDALDSLTQTDSNAADYRQEIVERDNEEVKKKALEEENIEPPPDADWEEPGNEHDSMTVNVLFAEKKDARTPSYDNLFPEQKKCQ